MNTTKDYIRPLFELFVDGKKSEFAKEANESLRAITDAISDLETQATTIRKAIAQVQQLPLSPKEPIPSQPPIRGLDEEQRRMVKDTAMELVRSNEKSQVKSDEIIQSLSRKGMKLNVTKPKAVVSSMLSKWGFKKVGTGKFQYSETS